MTAPAPAQGSCPPQAYVCPTQCPAAEPTWADTVNTASNVAQAAAVVVALAKEAYTAYNREDSKTAEKVEDKKDS